MNMLHIIASSIDLSPLPDIRGSQSTLITDIIGIVITVTAALSLLFIVVGGLRYIISQGDPQGVSKAKSTIMYALIGLVVAVFAQVIVSFVARSIG